MDKSILYFRPVKKVGHVPGAYTLITVLSMIICFSTCRSKDPSINISDIDKHIKEWMFFDTGTWWVYKEVNSGAIDSQFVTESKIYYLTSELLEGSLIMKAQFIEIHINKGFYFQVAPPSGGSLIEKTKYAGTEKVSSYLRFDPLRIGERKGPTGIGYTEILEIDPQYILGNKTDTLITLLDNYDLTEHNDSIEYKVMKGVGILSKKNITRNQHWQLIKYNIILNKK